MTETVWLVEIRLKDWRPNLPCGGRVVAYEEALAASELQARHVGFAQFEARCKNDPVTRLLMHNLSLDLADCCAPDAVVID